ncbi:hypothetical protein BKCO1_980006 [Neofusicoccum parvum]|nr:hypothetical protein BKCO1_980006 [Neofusicoccum parvum]
MSGDTNDNPNTPTAREVRARRLTAQRRNRRGNGHAQRPGLSFRGTPSQLTFGAIAERLRRSQSSRAAVLAAIRARCMAMCYAKKVQAERLDGMVAAGRGVAGRAERLREELEGMREAFGGDEAARFGHLDGQMEGLARGEEVVFRCCRCRKAGRARIVGEAEKVCECGHVCCILCLYVQREGDEMIEMELLSLEEPGRMDGKKGGRKDGGGDDDGGLGGDIGMAMDVGA